jgi:cell division protein FtsL
MTRKRFPALSLTTLSFDARQAVEDLNIALASRQTITESALMTRWLVGTMLGGCLTVAIFLETKLEKSNTELKSELTRVMAEQNSRLEKSNTELKSELTRVMAEQNSRLEKSTIDQNSRLEKSVIEQNNRLEKSVIEQNSRFEKIESKFENAMKSQKEDFMHSINLLLKSNSIGK